MERHHIGALLRLISTSALLLLVIGFFRHPLNQVLGPGVHTGLSGLGVERLLDPPARGFILQITSEPKKARVLVNGVDRGSTPLFANVDCREGQVVQFTLLKEGYQEFQQSVHCREGQTLKARIQLER